jgi:hypothetical protein
MPADTPKLPLNTIFAYGPGQFVGGVYGNVCAAYCENVAFANSVTTHGRSLGRGTGASAVTVFEEPTSPCFASFACGLPAEVAECADGNVKSRGRASGDAVATMGDAASVTAARHGKNRRSKVMRDCIAATCEPPSFERMTPPKDSDARGDRAARGQAFPSRRRRELT